MAVEGRTRPLAILGIVTLCWCIPAAAQVATPTRSPQNSQTTPGARKATTAARSHQMTVERSPSAPQVVTILHRLNGLKMFRLLLRSSEDLSAIARLDDSFKITDEVHTNVIAGLSLDDGQTIVAWLPDAEAEIGPLPAPFAPGFPTPPPAPGVPGTSPRSSRPAPGAPLTGPMTLFDRPDLTVIAKDGQRLIARYVGLDGGTGLSILKLSGKKLLPGADAKEANIAIGQHLRLLGPEPVPQPDTKVSGTVFARMGETEGKVVGILRGPSGAIARVKVRSAKLSATHIGGIAINDAGETVGIVDAVESNEATVMPSALVRSAVKRVLQRQASVPRPWLGISGEPVGTLELEDILVRGWHDEGARSLAEARRGIMLTSVAPGSPAAEAALRAGDVILAVNREEVKTADDLSWLLEAVGPGAEVRFTIARPDKPALEAVELTLSEFPDRFYALKWMEAQPRKSGNRVDQTIKPRAFSGSLLSSSLFAQGIETIALQSPVASRFGAKSGLLVVYVHPATAAFQGGLRSGDVIEAIDGHEVSSPSVVSAVSGKPGTSYSFTVVRNRERVEVKVVTSKN